MLEFDAHFIQVFEIRVTWFSSSAVNFKMAAVQHFFFFFQQGKLLVETMTITTPTYTMQQNIYGHLNCHCSYVVM